MLSHPPLSALAVAPPAAATATGTSTLQPPAMVTGTVPTTATATASAASTSASASASASHATAVGARARMATSSLVRFQEVESTPATTPTPPPHALPLPMTSTAPAPPTPSPVPRTATPVIPLPRTPVLTSLRVPLHRAAGAPTSPAGTTRSASSAAHTAQQQGEYATPPPPPLTLDQVGAVVQTARAFRSALHAVSTTGNDLARALVAVYRSRGSDADPSAPPPEKPARDMDVAFLAETLKVVGAAHQLLGDMVWRELEKPMDAAWNAIHEETLTQRTATDNQIAALRAQAAQAAAQATKLAKSRKEAKRNLAVHAHRQVAELDQNIASLERYLRAIGDRTAVARRPVIVATSGRVAGRMLAGYVNAGLALRALAETSRRRAPVAGDTLPLLNRGVVAAAAGITQGRRSTANMDGGADASGSVGRAAGTTVAPSPLVASQSLTSMASSRSSLSQARHLPSASTGSPLVELAAARRSLETAYGSRAVVPLTALASPARATSPLAFDGTASIDRSGSGTPPPQVVRQASSRASIWSMLSTSAVYGGGTLPDAAADAAPPPLPPVAMGTPVFGTAAVP